MSETVTFTFDLQALRELLIFLAIVLGGMVAFCLAVAAAIALSHHD